LATAANLQITVRPAGTRVWIERDGAARKSVAQAPLADGVGAAFAPTLGPGPLGLAFRAPGRVPWRPPVLLAPAEPRAAALAPPPAASAPPGMIYVPPGRFLFGSADSGDARRGFLKAAPLHEVSTAGYFIGRYEVTFGEWIAFLDDLPAEERRRRSPQL